jgi:hypothetical protein
MVGDLRHRELLAEGGAEHPGLPCVVMSAASAPTISGWGIRMEAGVSQLPFALLSPTGNWVRNPALLDALPDVRITAIILALI